jgi:hypothetical protein
MDVCLQDRILGFVSGTTVRNPPARRHQFGICDHEDASSEGEEHESHLVPRLHTAQQVAASCSSLAGSVSNIHCTALTMDQVSSIF